MAFRLFVFLILLKTIAAEDYSTQNYELPTRTTVYHPRNIRKLVTEPQNPAQSSTEVLQDQGSNYTVNNNTTKPSDKNVTVTQKPGKEKEEVEAESSEAVHSYPPYATYEVTEKVVDIPDDRTPAGPIITNYTKQPNLNLGKPNNQTDKNKIPETNIKNRKNSFSILHIKAEYDDKGNEICENKIVGFFKGIQKKFHSFHRGILKGFHSFFLKHEHDHGDGKRFERSADEKENHRVENVQNVDKTDYFVRQKHISLT